MGNDAISCGGIRISFPKWISLKMSSPTKENIPLTHTHKRVLISFASAFFFFPLELVCWACLILSGHLWCVSRPSKSQHCILACVFLLTIFFWRLSPGTIHWRRGNKNKATGFQDCRVEGGMGWSHGHYFIFHWGIISQTGRVHVLYGTVMSSGYFFMQQLYYNTDLNFSWCVFRSLPLFLLWTVNMWMFLENSVISIKVECFTRLCVQLL